MLVWGSINLNFFKFIELRNSTTKATIPIQVSSNSIGPKPLHGKENASYKDSTEAAKPNKSILVLLS
jgi:hypothetical protein